MSLFEVEFTVRAVVQADDSTHAFQVAMENSSEIFSADDQDDFHVGREITSASMLPAGWNAECFPYGNDNRRIGEILVEPAPERDTKTIDMFAEAP